MRHPGVQHTFLVIHRAAQQVAVCVERVEVLAFMLQQRKDRHLCGKQQHLNQASLLDTTPAKVGMPALQMAALVGAPCQGLI